MVLTKDDRKKVIETHQNHKTDTGSPVVQIALLTERISYLFRAPARGDIVVFSTTGIDSPMVPPGQYFVKRIVGIPGDKVLFDPPGVRVNGHLLTNPPIFARISTRTNGYCGYTAQGELAVSQLLELKDGEYFVAGDNSQNSLDSRYYGPIRRKQITARAAFIYYPLRRWGFLE